MLQSHLVVVAQSLGQVDKLQEVQLSPAQTYWLTTVWDLLHLLAAWKIMFSSSGQGQTSYVPSEGISCKELAASGNEHLLKPGGENRHGDGVDDKDEEEKDAII